jgi:hypothetical protein
MNDNRFRKLAWLTLALALPRPATAAAPKPLQVRVYASVYTGLRESEARDVARGVTDLIARRLDYPVSLDLQAGTTAADIEDFGNRLANGTYHLGVVWGIEYAWLKKFHPDLDVLTVCSQGPDVTPQKSHLLVRTNEFTDWKKLRNKRLARFASQTRMDVLLLNEMVKRAGEDPDRFFPKEGRKSYPSPKAALRAVVKNEADCVVVNAMIFNQMKKLYPWVGDELVSLKGPLSEETYPDVAIIGSPEQVKKLRESLWQDMQKELRTVLKTPEGEDLKLFWGFGSFVDPSEEYRDAAAKCAERYPLNLLRQED